jgi:hypothetical protein
MTWTIHQGYLGDPKGFPIADTLIFVKHKERSYEAIALYTVESIATFIKKIRTHFSIIYRVRYLGTKNVLEIF